MAAANSLLKREKFPAVREFAPRCAGRGCPAERRSAPSRLDGGERAAIASALRVCYNAPAREAAGTGPDGAASHLPAMKILTCNSNRPLAEAISAYLGLPLTKASVRRFSDMEVFVEIQENVRG